MEARTISARPDVTFATTTPRVTPTPPRAGKFGEVLSNTVVKSAESAMSMLPGSPMMALAVRSVTGAATSSIPLASSTSGASGGLSLPSSIGGVGSTSVAGATSASGPTATGATGTTGTGGAGIDSSLQQSQEMNLYYLQVQETVNQQNRSFTTFSNVMKAQHDTVKNAIGNIR